MPRPPSVIDPSTFHIIGNPLTSLAMPSGHSLTAFTIATAFYFSLSSKKRKSFLWLFLIATGSGISRIAVGAHWPADVLAGTAIGLFCGVVGSFFASKLPITLLNPQSWLIRALSVASLLCLYMLATTVIDFKSTFPFQLVGIAVVVVTTVLFFKQTLQK